MSNAEARAWWDDVQHLRPDAAPTTRRPSALKDLDDLPSVEELDAWLAREAAAPTRFEREQHVAEERREQPPAVTAEIALRRRPAAAPAPRATTGSEGLLAARAAEAAAVAGPALRRAAREVSERKPRSPLDRTLSMPDRIALWAVILGLLLVVIAATTSNAQAAVL